MKPLLIALMILPCSLFPIPCSLAITPASTERSRSEQALDQFEQQLLAPTPSSLPTTQPVTPVKANPVGFITPARGVLTSGYGWRWGRMHKGVDIAAPIGTPIVAAASGTVISAGWNKGGYGQLVEIRHADGSITRYAHNSQIIVAVGQQVEQGQAIALMGSTGYSTGSHCHFEIILVGKGAVNPLSLISPANTGALSIR